MNRFFEVTEPHEDFCEELRRREESLLVFYPTHVFFLRYQYFAGPINKNFAHRFFSDTRKFTNWSKNPGYASEFNKISFAIYHNKG